MPEYTFDGKAALIQVMALVPSGESKGPAMWSLV